jgi:hypothetical protein
MFSCFALVGGVESVIEALTCFIGSFIPILLSIAILVFFWGLVKFIAHAGDEKAVAEGKQLIIWGLVGIFVMITLWSIVGYIQTLFGIDYSPIGETAPSLPSMIL